ncbi:MAG: lipoate--protein ligase family protein [Gemmataceae bacterium]|nr:lipoate--protein ligase family protein [Gemmataceae bacterium]MDW8267399.1 lipoate--protein ligase family protein [Gemmataceae bacterium]
MEAMNCRLLPWEVGDGAANMAADEVLLETACVGRAGLRFYAWSQPTLSLGYFQPAALGQGGEPWARLPRVRRPSGGGALIHHVELTYALALPAGPRWQPVGNSWLVRMHGLIAAALREFGVLTQLWAGGSLGQPADAPLCFQRLTRGDLLLDAAKIVGSAQRRRRGALLQHGAILLAASPHAPELAGIFEQTGRRIACRELAEAIRSTFVQATNWTLHEDDWHADERRLIGELATGKYQQPTWNLKR